MFTCLLKDRIKGTDGHPHGEGAQNLIGTRYVCVCVCACVCMCNLHAFSQQLHIFTHLATYQTSVLWGFSWAFLTLAWWVIIAISSPSLYSREWWAGLKMPYFSLWLTFLMMSSNWGVNSESPPLGWKTLLSLRNLHSFQEMWARTQDRCQYILCYPIHLSFFFFGGWQGL